MSQAFPGLPSPAAGFDQPFEMLQACHDRVRRTLSLLQRLTDHVAVHGGDRAARDAAQDVLRYFDLAAPAHHDDEERHVLPRLRASGRAADAALADRLQHDHRRMERSWQGLRARLQALRDEGAVDAMALAREAEAFIALYEAHLALEDDDAFPQAEARARDEGATALQAMGEEMAQRRGARRG